MASHQLSIDTSSLQFIAEIRRSDASSIFEVELDGQKRALKVYHGNGDEGHSKKGRDLNGFRCELNAYQKLFAAGVCDRGFVPFFHGYFDRIKPENPALHQFTKDKFHPREILLEYLSNAESLNCVNYSEALYPQAIEGMKEIRKAHVLHEDIYPKNILLVRNPDRLVWIDFDVATILPIQLLRRSRLATGRTSSLPVSVIY